MGKAYGADFFLARVYNSWVGEQGPKVPWRKTEQYQAAYAAPGDYYLVLPYSTFKREAWERPFYLFEKQTLNCYFN